VQIRIKIIKKPMTTQVTMKYHCTCILLLPTKYSIAGDNWI